MKSQLSQLQQKQTLLKIFIFTLVTIIIWVGLTLFRTQQQTGIRPELLVKAEALNPNISVQVIDQIEQKRVFTEAELSDFPIYSIVTLKTGEQQLVVFSASDKERREATFDAPVQTGPPAVEGQPAEAATPAQAPATTGGGTITVEQQTPQEALEPPPGAVPQAPTEQ